MNFKSVLKINSDKEITQLKQNTRENAGKSIEASVRLVIIANIYSRVRITTVYPEDFRRNFSVNFISAPLREF